MTSVLPHGSTIDSAEEALRAVEERFRAVVESTSDCVLLWDTEYTNLYANRAALVHTGTTPDAVIGKSLHEALENFPGRSEAWMRRTDDVVATGREARFEESTTLGDRVITTESLMSPLRDESGNVTEVVLVSRDISDRRAAERRLEQRTLELERSNEELEEFAYIASHDLSAPLRAISGYLDLVRRRHASETSPEMARFIERAILATVRMQQMIDDLLSFSRASQRELVVEPVPMADVVQNVLETLAAPIDATGAVIEVGELPVIPADRVQMTQLLQNLVSNAVKFHGDDAPLVRIDVRRERDEWRLSVSDNGIGVEPQYVEGLFRMFHRLNGDRYEGSGIGLAVCKRIVDRHGGTSRHEPAPGGGSVFSFTVPAEKTA